MYASPMCVYTSMKVYFFPRLNQEKDMYLQVNSCPTDN